MDTTIQVLASVLMLGATISVLSIAKLALRYAKSKSDNQCINDAIDIIQDAVDQVNQTYVADLKESGDFTAENQKIALQTAIENSINKMSDETKNYIEDNYGDITDYVTSKIESYIWRTKETTITEVIDSESVETDDLK